MHRPAANVLKTVLAVAGVGAAGVAPQPEPVEESRTVPASQALPFAVHRTHSRNKAPGPRSQAKRRLLARRRNQV